MCETVIRQATFEVFQNVSNLEPPQPCLLRAHELVTIKIPIVKIVSFGNIKSNHNVIVRILLTLGTPAPLIANSIHAPGSATPGSLGTVSVYVNPFVPDGTSGMRR